MNKEVIHCSKSKNKMDSIRFVNNNLIYKNVYNSYYSVSWLFILVVSAPFRALLIPITRRDWVHTQARPGAIQFTICRFKVRTIWSGLPYCIFFPLSIVQLIHIVCITFLKCLLSGTRWCFSLTLLQICNGHAMWSCRCLQLVRLLMYYYFEHLKNIYFKPFNLTNHSLYLAR